MVCLKGRREGPVDLPERRTHRAPARGRKLVFGGSHDHDLLPPLARRAREHLALADVGLDGDEAALDIRDLRSLVDCIRLVRRTAMQTAVRMITTGVMLALLAGIAIKLRIFGGGP